ncbi:MAG: DUF6030 family protein [Hoeflea sp.]|uniref:DUF6030 family protein n=1 Tax=Hoeflea sp. TaxID=1940281 RepID=UPI0032EC5BD4
MKKTSRPHWNSAFFVVTLVVIFAGLASVVLLANEARNLNRLLAWAGVPPDATPSVDADMSTTESAQPPGPTIHVPEHLTEPPVVAPQDGFYRTITKRREDICSALQKKGWVSGQWQAADPGQRTWSCGAEKLLAANGDPDSPIGSLFVSARGMESDTVSSVRLKANFLDGDISGPVRAQATNAARDILDAIGWGEDPEVMENLRQWKVFKLEGNGNSISLSREPSDVPRYNFLIASDPPGMIGEGAPLGGQGKWLKSPGPEN